MAQAESGAGRFGLVVGGAALVLFVVSPLLTFLGIVAPLAGFRFFGLGGLLGLAALLVGAVTAWRRGWQAARPGVILGVLVSAVFVYLALSAREFPVINDVSTSTSNPPQFVRARELPGNAGRDMSYPGESFAQQQRAAYPDIGPRALDVPVPEAFARVEAAARKMAGWEVTRVDAAAGVLEGVAVSRVFRFRDDFVIEVRPEDGRSLIHMRSKSRDGRSDIGANAARIRAFFATLG
jgi:uncharacterized protein (DUF1499 family)